MKLPKKNLNGFSILGLLFVVVFAVGVSAQTTAFNYQGRLTDGSSAANGTYEMQFRLLNASSGGTQVGSTITNNSVTVTNGIFYVSLDFGSSPFSGGANRWLEIGVRKASDPPGFTILTPLQPITSSPYAVYTLGAASADSLSANCVNCIQNSMLAPNSVTTSKVANGTVTTAKLTLDAVTTAQIFDGTITNADINAAAAIDGTKITGSTIANLNASNLASGTVADARLSSSVTLQGNTVNAANGLVKLDASAKLPAVDGSQLTNITASSGGLAVFNIAAGNTYAIATGGIGNSATRTFVGLFGGANGTGTTVTITLPPANSYPAGTVLRISATDYITAAPSVQYQRTGTTSDLLHGFNQGTGAAGPGFPGTLSSWATDGVSNWYKVG